MRKGLANPSGPPTLCSRGVGGPCWPEAWGLEGSDAVSLATSARSVWPRTHPAAPGLSRAPPSLSLSSQGCPSGPRGLSFASRSSCPLLSSQTPLHQQRESRLPQVTPARTQITAFHPGALHPLHLAFQGSSPCLCGATGAAQRWRCGREG